MLPLLFRTILALSFLTVRLSVLASSSSIRVDDFGYTYVGTLSTVLVFYIELLNEGHRPVRTEIVNEKCCLHVMQDDEECEGMRLPAKTGILQPIGSQESSKNFEFMFHSMYVMNRKGVCIFAVREQGKVHKEHVRISFDTILPNFAECESVDLDPERECRPSNCVLKYMGMRNFFNKNSLMCEPVEECMTLSADRRELIAFYDHETNTCVRLDEGIGSVETAEEDDSPFVDEILSEQ